MIRANCRERFTDDDVRFVVDTLGQDAQGKKRALTQLLTDAQSRDNILDSEVLFERLVANKDVSKVSPHLYFYLLTRKVFLEEGIDDRDLTDYVAAMLAQFSSAHRWQRASHMHDKTYQYFVDMMIDSAAATPFEAFLLRSHMGNYALFMSGLFPDRIYYKATYGRKAPGFDYYEKMGSSSYRWASRHELALKYCLVDILAQLADQFHTVRLALNHLADNYMKLDDRNPPPLDKLLRQIFFGRQGEQKFDR